MSGSAARVAHMRNWVDQLEADIARVTVERDALWKAIAVLDPDSAMSPLSRALAAAETYVPPTLTVTSSDVVPAALVAGTKPKTRGPGKKQLAKGTAYSKPAVAAGGSAKVSQIGDAPSTRQPGGKTSKYDYAKIAEAAHAAALAGGTIDSAVRTLYPEISIDMAKWVVREARKRGFTIAKQDRQTVLPVVDPKPLPTGPTSKVDYVEAAALIVELRVAGQPIAEGLAKRYGIPESTARTWMQRCREMGLVKPLDANLKVIEDNTIDPDAMVPVYDALAVAGAYLEAIRNNMRPIQNVADSLGIDKARAAQWVRQARLDGTLPATSLEPQLSAEERRKLLEVAKPEPALV